jgi:hypothetical protein
MPLPRTTRRAATALVAAALLGGAVPLALATEGPPAAALPPGERSVTLVTGDRVTFGASGRTVHIEPGPGREGVTFDTRDFGGRLEVLPSDAIAPLSAGRVDRRLFDVTALLEMGYGDGRDNLPLIVTHAGGAAAKSARSKATAAGKVTRDLPTVSGFGLQLRKADAVKLWRDIGDAGIGKLWLDARLRVTLDTSVGQIGTPAAWAAGHTGAGTTVAVLDTGVDDTHPDLAGKVRDRATLVEGEDAIDHHGHGTHVASTIAGSGAASQGRYRGVAPDATLLDGKVCDGGGWCQESNVLAGMRWAAEQGADVVNLSLGHTDTAETDPLEQAVQELTARHGTLFVVAGGNDGKDRSIGSPASAPAALAVGAVDGQNALANFSSRGPRLGDSGLKPEITAPGVDITAARTLEGGYVAMSGTSMATPHVAGAAAILAGVRPDWGADRLKSALMGTAQPGNAGVFAQGAGRVDVAAATTARVTADEGGVGFGRQVWPHHDDPVLTRTVTYRNHGDAPITLDLTVAGDAALFAVSPARLTVPADGTAEATVTADTRVDVPDGFRGGYLRASATGVAVSTPLAVEKEIESYDVAFTVVGFDGAPTTLHETGVYRVDGGPDVYYADSVWEAGIGKDAFTLRLPKGRWVVRSSIINADASTVALLTHPRLDLGADQNLALDARLGQPVSVTLPDAGAEQVHASIYHSGTIGTGERYAFSSGGEDYNGWRTAQLGPDTSYDGVVSKIDGTWVTAGASYDLGVPARGRFPTGFARTFAKGDLARITHEYAQQVPGSTGWHYSASFLPDAPMRAYVRQQSFTLPATRAKYVNTDDGLEWEHAFWERYAGGQTTLWSPALTSYRAGTQYSDAWNKAVLGPTEVSGVNRIGDQLTASPALFGDAAGHIGASTVGNTAVTLHRDGVPVTPELGDGLLYLFRVPPEEATYRLVYDVERDAPVTLSTRTRVEWTFRSGHVDGDAPARLATSVVRYAPVLADGQTAPAGCRFDVPFAVRRQPGSSAGPVRTLAVDVSFDDGATWTPAAVRRHGERGVATVTHPSGTGYVSLRATSTDTAGNTVTQTITRAYRFA